MNAALAINIQDSLKLMDKNEIVSIKVSIKGNFLNIVTITKDASRHEKKIGIFFSNNQSIFKIAREMLPQNIITIEKIGSRVSLVFSNGSTMSFILERASVTASL